jgi:hypothetical protein
VTSQWREVNGSRWFHSVLLNDTLVAVMSFDRAMQPTECKYAFVQPHDVDLNRYAG